MRRHPHVFGDVTVSGADEVTQNWDEIKKREKADQAERSGVPAAGQPAPSALDGVPFGQPALALAAALQRRELFRLVAQARALGLDPEAELRAAARRYGDLVRAWERSRPPADR